MSIWKKQATVEALNASNPGTLNEALGIQFTEIGADYLRGTLPGDRRTRQPFGLLHGGASVSLAESLGSVAGWLSLPADGGRTMGLEINANHLRAVTDVVLPEWGPFRRHLAARVIGSERFNLKGLSVRGGTLRALVDAGVLVGMGSDSGNWPVFPYHFHGTNSLKEIELLGTYGFTPEQALLLSTANAARLIEVDDRVGTLELGKEADIVLVRGDPLRVASDIWNIQGTIQDGVYRTPEGWMQEDARGL